MRIVIAVVCVLLSVQVSADPRYGDVEIYLWSVSEFSDKITEFQMEAIGAVWDMNNTMNYSTTTYELTEDYDSLYFEYYESEIIDYWGWHHNISGGSEGETFGHAFYKLCVDNKDFYLDYRDDSIGFYNFSDPDLHNFDIWMKYDHGADYLYVTPYDNFSGWTTFEDGDTITFWGLKGAGPPSTGKFEPRPPEDLSVTEITPDEEYYLTWDHHSPVDDYWTKYYVYRSISSIYPPVYSLLDSVSKTTTSYFDDDMTVGTGQTVYYKVKAKNTSALSDFSNEAPEYSGPTGTPQTPSNFHVTWVTCTGGWNPKLEWNLITGDPRIHGYKLHRSFDGSTGTYSLRATVNSSTSYFIDTQIIKSSTTKNSDYVHYKLQSYTFPVEDPQHSEFAGPLVCRYDEDGGYMPKQLASINQVIPDKYSLNQNYPNPFNPLTIISYGIPKSSIVNLRVIDINGRVVKTLMNDSQEAGFYKATWDGMTENGEHVSTGMYLCMLQASEYSQIIKMAYLR